jgi:DNA-binding response OmpR family regulator
MRVPIRASASDESTPHPSSGADEEMVGDGGRILVIDDYADNRRLFAAHLRRAGYEVEEIGDGFEALRSIVDRGEIAALDGIVLDIQLPGMDGCQIARVVRAAEVDVAIVAASANGTSDERGRCLAAGCDEVVAKPLSGEELVAAVRRSLRRRRMHRSAPA